ncbi:hypothetical protein GN958_ATG05791 [Phytophthora infestans]|uniref:Uncharacterized protein n=2 Tax=Phytophthora infestans TaxID=4787 RepID=A0A8S9V0W7_PHYIN|nr:hypothetical protein GN958_ATG05791 [Phytophthora infestans]
MISSGSVSDLCGGGDRTYLLMPVEILLTREKTKGMAARRETRLENSAFMKRLEMVHADDRARLLRDHRAYFAGERSADADFASARLAVLRPPPYKPPPMVDEPWEPDDEKDEGEDKGSAWEDDDEFEALSSIKYSAQTKTTNKTKTTGKTSGKTKVVAKAKVVEKKKSTGKTPRKKSSKTLAKEAREAAATSKRNTAAKKRQDPANDDQQAGKKAKDAARKHLEGKK